jgi:hypothetical protein
MSTLRVTNVQDTAGANSLTTAQIYNGAAKAWVNFDGTGVVAIRASFNVSSITDNGTGQYTANLTTAMPDINGSALCNTNSDTSTQHSVTISVPSSSTVRVRQFVSASYADASEVFIGLFR